MAAEDARARTLRDIGDYVPYVAFGAYVVTLPCLPSQLSLMGAVVHGFLSSASLSLLLAAALACGVAMGVRALRRPRKLVLSRAFVLIGSALYGAGCILYVLLEQGMLPASNILASLAGLLCGVGGIAPALAWGYLYSRLTLREAAWCVSCGLGLASAVNFLFVIGLFQALVPVTAVMLVVGLSFPLAASARGPLVCGSSYEDAVRDAEMELAESERDELRGTGRLFSQSMLPTVFSMCLGLFMLVLASSARCGAFDAGIMVREYEYYESIAPSLAAVCLAVFLAARRRFDLSETAHFYIPVIAVGFFALSAFAVNSPVFDFGFLASHVLLSVIALLALSSFSGIVRIGELSPWLLCSLLYAGVALSALIGVSLYAWIPGDALGAALLLLATLYFMFVVLSALLGQRRLIRDMSEEEGGARGTESSARAASIAQARDSVASEFGLTAREKEIMLYVAAGHGSPYIAEKLFISEYTVRTHMRNVYRKVGVGTKEELIVFIEEAAHTPSHPSL